MPYGKTAPVIAENSGELVASKNSPVTEALSELVHELSGRPRAKQSLIGRLMKTATRSLQTMQSSTANISVKSAPVIEAPPAKREAPAKSEPAPAKEPEPVSIKTKNGQPTFSDTFGDTYASNEP